MLSKAGVHGIVLLSRAYIKSSSLSGLSSPSTSFVSNVKCRKASTAERCGGLFCPIEILHVTNYVYHPTRNLASHSPCLATFDQKSLDCSAMCRSKVSSKYTHALRWLPCPPLTQLYSSINLMSKIFFQIGNISPTCLRSLSAPSKEDSSKAMCVFGQNMALCLKATTSSKCPVSGSRNQLKMCHQLYIY